MSKSPLTRWRSGARERRYSYVSRSVRFPRQRIWPILPGVRSFRNCSQVRDSSGCWIRVGGIGGRSRWGRVRYLCWNVLEIYVSWGCSFNWRIEDDLNGPGHGLV